MNIAEERSLKQKALDLRKAALDPATNLPELVSFLGDQIASTHSEQWKTICTRWRQWVEKRHLAISWKFDPSTFLCILDSSCPLEEKVFHINHSIRHITARHRDVIQWFESQLNTADPRMRAVCRKVLHWFGTKGLWQATAAAGLPNVPITYWDFCQVNRESQLWWLEQARTGDDKGYCLFEWGATALLHSRDPFILSKLAKILPEIYSPHDLDFTHVLRLLEGFLSHLDSRVRSNTVEGLGVFLSQEIQSEAIKEHMIRMLNDPDPRVRTTSLLQLHRIQPRETLLRIQEIVSAANSKNEIQSLIWLLQQALKLDEAFGPLLELAEENLHELNLFFPEETLDWI